MGDLLLVLVHQSLQLVLISLLKDMNTAFFLSQWPTIIRI